MLIRYEYELLSYIASKGIKKTNGDIVVSLKRIEDEIVNDNLNSYLSFLDILGIIDLDEDKVIIKTEEWIKLFLDNLSKRFAEIKKCIICNKREIINSGVKSYYVEFIINGSQKVFELEFSNLHDIDVKEENKIFMCISNIYDNNIYWLDLINNVNLLNMFYSYLINEINNINKEVYMELDVFQGLEEKYISEIFNVEIKRYFKGKKYKIKNFDRDENKVIESFVCKEDICYYGVEFGQNEILWVINDENKIIFISTKDGELTYSQNIESEISILCEKILKKISEFKSLIFVKENNILDNTLKVVGQTSIILMPASLIISIIALLGINIKLFNTEYFSYILWGIIIILSVIQIYLIKIIYLPTFKLNKFSWKIE